MNETLHEKEPQYFTQFRQHFDLQFKDLKKEMNDRFDSQEEQIVKVSEDLTMLTRKVDKIEVDINIIKEDIVIMKEDIAGCKSDLVDVKEVLKEKADKRDLTIFNRRLTRLEEKHA